MRRERWGILMSAAVALLAAGVFLAGAGLMDNYTWFERGGGALWLFVLVLLAVMPLVIPAVRRRAE